MASSFSCRNLCRGCMENVDSGGSLTLFNKKKQTKTQVCNNFEELTKKKVMNNDRLPHQLCMLCVTELNKCFSFKEKCLRTDQTLRSYLEIDISDEESQEEIHISSLSVHKPSESNEATKEECYEEIEVTQENSAKSDDLAVLINEHQGSSGPLKLEGPNSNEEFFLIIEDISPNLEQTQIQNSKVDEEKGEKTKTENNCYKCSICELEFVRKKNYDNHFRRYHNETADDDDDGPLIKKVRLKLTKSEDNIEQLKQELDLNPDTKRCKRCGALYLNEKSLRLHEKRNACHLCQSYNCNVCKKTFTDHDLFNQHTDTHPQEEQDENVLLKIEHATDPLKKFHCSACKKSFKMLSTLKDHLRTHTQEKPYVCSICSRGFSQNTNLKQHLRRHTQIKPFKCTHDDCTASFVSKGELSSHLRKHSGDHPFICVICKSGFTTSSSLLKHKRIHSGEKPYACKFCPMRFTALGTLKNHQRTHTGERPYLCNFCDRAFTQKSDKSAHERTHTGSRPYQCKICNSAFNQSGTLRTHMKIHDKADAD